MGKGGKMQLQRYTETRLGKTLWVFPDVGVDSGTYSKYHGNTWETFTVEVIGVVVNGQRMSSGSVEPLGGSSSSKSRWRGGRENGESQGD